ncbi:hypothetical protein HAX54_013664 [Datura stramonium]|uniref:Cobalamin-independent methionine synthase MetE C-terminal/archaeal domain-containing protein n=1 Tax=Datura stramonium TaxID=4076 RepID=A0ABS8TNE2_DATST|nr:hypothetical protein [Datura stramonium]
MRCSGHYTDPHSHVLLNFNDIIHSIIDMDADVITIENSRSDEKLLSVFREGVKYGAGIGPGVYDIHSPRIPSTEEIADRVNKMLAVLDTNILLAVLSVGHLSSLICFFAFEAFSL